LATLSLSLCWVNIRKSEEKSPLLIAWFNWRASVDPETIYFRLLRDGQKEMTIEELDVLEYSRSLIVITLSS
jgi:hypothetical protein